MSTVIAAIDLGPSSARVLYHAAGFARLLSARLEVLHVSGEVREFVESRVLDFCARLGPHEIDPAAVDIADRSMPTCGPVLAAIDLTEPCERQLRLASECAAMAGQPLLLMTVAPAKVSVDDATWMLRERADRARLAPEALIVRRGRVASEISRCALQEGAGLVVMGLRSRHRSTPGVIAAAVLKTKHAFVLAVPGC